jgi:hypothetical protein
MGVLQYLEKDENRCVAAIAIGVILPIQSLV